MEERIVRVWTDDRECYWLIKIHTKEELALLQALDRNGVLSWNNFEDVKTIDTKDYLR